MSLAVYDRKRNFKHTTEPRPRSSARKKSKLTFVVQRHSARKLHWDFRLEMSGVLKSWAIPKGPSMVAGEKRLAIMVEDHPLEYGKFFGEIPEGSYGAGTVEIWDEGSYRPSVDPTTSPEEILNGMLTKGDLKLTLDGTYLRGRFALFRLNTGEKQNEWMLVKKADEYAGDSFDIESLPPLRSLGSAKKGKSQKTVTPDPFPDPLPKPMLAKLAEHTTGIPDWISEPKLDGYRMLCAVRNGKAELISRNGNSYTKQFALLLNDLQQIEESIVLDGEVVAENSRGRSDFQLLQKFVNSGKGDLKYYVFDILYISGHKIMMYPLRERKEILLAFFSKYHFNRVINVIWQTGNIPSHFESLSGKGYEGIIVKDPESHYLPGKRSDSWLKIKAVQKQEAVICGYTTPRGSRKYLGSLVLGQYENGKLEYIGNCGTGFTDYTLNLLFEKFGHLQLEVCPFGSEPDLSGEKGRPVWLKPQLVASIKFMEWTADNLMRMPVFLGLRDDKLPEEVTKEQLWIKKGDISEKNRTIELSGNKVSLTNIDKIYWKEEGYTKGDLISYYQSIGKFIIPYLKDRPQSLNRYPGGIEGKSFYHKDMDAGLVPKWVRTVRMQSGSHAEGINYLICNNIATLIYMINLGCIEINPWHSTWDKPEYPTYIILDLDPGNIPFLEVVNSALVIKEICDEIDIPCYPKTSGATGMHIYIPMGEKYDYDQARTFAEILASLAHNRLLSTTSVERSVSKREDKVYIDFLQNRKGQTIASPYSVRPRPHATVSVPLLWSEVNHNLSPEMFTMKNTARRLEKTGDLWEPVLKVRISLARALKAIERLG